MGDNGCVAMAPTGFVHQSDLDLAVRRAEDALRPDVAHIRYSLGEDWSGAGAVFFRVLLADNASQRGRLQEVARRVSSKIAEEVQPDSFGLQSYFNFRSESEQQQLREPAWA